MLLFSFAGCKPDIKETGATTSYFDIKGYFENEAALLTAHNKPVLKTAVHNQTTETKKVTINNWPAELNLFSSSDINKPAWKDSYWIQTTPTNVLYKAKTPDLATRVIIVTKTGDKIKWILIVNHTKNLLYETKEKLTYFPDSLYRIEKTQHVRLLGTNTYDIKGIF